MHHINDICIIYVDNWCSYMQYIYVYMCVHMHISNSSAKPLLNISDCSNGCRTILLLMTRSPGQHYVVCAVTTSHSAILEQDMDVPVTRDTTTVVPTHHGRYI